MINAALVSLLLYYSLWGNTKALIGNLVFL